VDRFCWRDEAGRRHKTEDRRQKVGVQSCFCTEHLLRDLGAAIEQATRMNRFDNEGVIEPPEFCLLSPVS
jgi:hypothetical protein